MWYQMTGQVSPKLDPIAPASKSTRIYTQEMLKGSKPHQQRSEDASPKGGAATGNHDRYPTIVYTTTDHKSWHLPPIRFYPLMPRHACWIGDVRTSQFFKSQATPLTGILKTDLSPIVARRAVEITDNPSLSALSTCMDSLVWTFSKASHAAPEILRFIYHTAGI